MGVKDTSSNGGTVIRSNKSISIIGFLQAIKMASDDNGIHQRGNVWLLPNFMKSSAAAELTGTLSFNSKS